MKLVNRLKTVKKENKTTYEDGIDRDANDRMYR